jgi:hypothetical protein
MPRYRSVLVASLLVAATAASASAQGSDACATAQLVAGTGTFPFSSVGASTDGTPDPACLFFGVSDIFNDVWFQWTAPSSGIYSIDDCGQTALDTKIAVLDGACGAPVLACNDDACSLQSRVSFSAVGGNVYTLRVGSYSASATGSGTITIALVPPPTVEKTVVNPANGHTYHQLAGSSWTDAEGAAVQLGGHLVTIVDQAEHDWIVQNFHNFQGLDIDLWTGLNDVAAEGSFAWSSGAPVTFTNWDTGEPNNANGIEDFCALRKNNPLALWNDLADAPTGFHANPHGLVEIESAITSFCFGDGLDTSHTTQCPCGNNGAAGHGCANSVNPSGANLDATGTTNPDTIVLAGSGMPVTAACIYLQGDLFDDAAFGDGVRCVGGTLLRLRAKVNSGGASQFPDSTDTVTLSQRGGVTPGSGVTRAYQTYYRNAAAAFCPPETFNVTDGATIVW